MNVERLVTLVKTLRNAPKELAKHFTMKEYAYDGQRESRTLNVVHDGNVPACGTPACALGWYATAPQKDFKIHKTTGMLQTKDVYGDFWAQGHCHNIKVASEHFGIDYNEAMELFDAEGCNKAQSAKQAANYIERFIVRKLKEEMHSPKDGTVIGD